VTHGDEFDGVVLHAKWLAMLGDVAYRALLSANTLFNRARRHLGFGYWSLSAYLKTRVKNALQFIENFEAAIADEARRRGVDGVICGHIHKAEMREIGGTLYINDGDWVESCTALVEHMDGKLEILAWTRPRAIDAVPAEWPAPRRRRAFALTGAANS
jgi:UDP-2,3-diacylglucosamine pyrophosphatase LpxH